VSDMQPTTQLTRCGTGPFRLDVCCPVCHEGRYDLALRPWLVQKLVIVRITTLRYTCVLSQKKTRDTKIYAYGYRGRKKRNENGPMSTPSRTKARISRLGSIANHLRKTSSSLYNTWSRSSSSSLLLLLFTFVHPSKTDSALRS